MKKILIVSDTHGQSDLMHELIRLVKPLDMLVHCGDVGYAGADRELMLCADCPVYIVNGNNDYGCGYPATESFEVAGRRVLVTHGHRQRVYFDLNSLFYFALENNADIVMFGHLHMPLVAQEKGVTFINPGSLTLPRQANRLPSYIMMTVTDSNEIEYAIRYVSFNDTGIEVIC